MKTNNFTYTSDIAFTPAVKALQKKYHSRKGYARMEQSGGWQTEVNEGLEQFLTTIDSFYLATSNSDGQPYIQHRGGPKGFLKKLNNRMLAFADYRGNKQYISAGNLNENNKSFIFLMDYPNRTRIKIWGSAKVEYDDKALIKSLSDSNYNAHPERAIIFTVEAWDVNCPQHITPRFTEEQVRQVTDPLKKRIKELEAKLGLTKDNQN
ncbi:pyridoxamine 5'-phosphate oxidase family protein [Pseudotenacibaculum haliotis]|uniref:Pyridoxamine 5'-phosphate oxidase family protein n=1 Tax=Pseudotenacibaculum haliotis TaxID=1862138 RepID=A0ABW5LTU4_9FLAO